MREDWIAHGRDWTRAGFQALAVHRFGAARAKIASRVLRAPLSLAYRAMYGFVRNVYGIELPHTVRIGRRVIFEHQHGIVVHGRAVIGDDCIVRHGVTLGLRSLDRLEDAPVLGRGVDIGAGAKILGAIEIGDGARIGANAVVLDSVPRGALAVGVPARIVQRASVAARNDLVEGRPRGAPA